MSNIKEPLALLSVTNKTGIVEFAKGLEANGYTILSTGGTAKILSENNVKVIEVADYAKSPEIFNGRVKTLHPKIHGGILMDRNNEKHLTEAKEHSILPIDMVVVNLYQFEKEAVNQKLTIDQAIEFIDIGGPTMLRASAKNHQYCLPVIDPDDYELVLKEVEEKNINKETRVRLATKVFKTISKYDAMIASYLDQDSEVEPKEELPPQNISLQLTQKSGLRYGENPHQKAAIYTDPNSQASGFDDIEVLQGKELSYNNYIDCNAATSIVRDLSSFKAIAIIKHTNPCGAAIGTDEELAEIYKKALSGDPKSAFGGIIATNQVIDGETASLMSKTFFECIVAPDFTEEAREIFSKKKNLRLLAAPFANKPLSDSNTPWELKQIEGAYLLQSKDTATTTPGKWNVVTEVKPKESIFEDLTFAMIITKHVKSNAIVYVKDRKTITVGAGQMSRIDAANFAKDKAAEEDKSLKGAVLASDAFFPFRDTVDLAAKAGIEAIIQPGGSKRDQESIDACNENNITMIFTGNRHFKH